MGGSYIALRKQVSSSVGAERDTLTQNIDALDAEIKALLGYADGYASKGQLEYLSTQLNNIKGELEKERGNLQALEPKLDNAQKMVEGKETSQQELKSAKEEDEVKLKELLENYDTISHESLSLEQQLALSLKNLDNIMNEVQMTPDQKAILQELSNSLANSGGALRDLLMEYETLNERLNALKQQLGDLEDEYTKLVERQLGE